MKKGGESWHKETVSFLFFFVNKWMGKIHQKFNPHGKYWGKEINPQTWHKISLTHGNPEEITVLKQGIKSSLDTGIYTEKDYPALHNSGRLLILHMTISRAPWWKLRPCVLFVSFPHHEKTENLWCTEEVLQIPREKSAHCKESILQLIPCLPLV